MSDACTVHRVGDRLHLGGRLERGAVTRAWTEAQAAPLAGVAVLDLAGLDTLDSAGLALLGVLAAASGADIEAGPAALPALRRAYRLDHRLQPLD
jgi:ABC-type transporter Mla MlaB component